MSPDDTNKNDRADTTVDLLRTRETEPSGRKPGATEDIATRQVDTLQQASEEVLSIADIPYDFQASVFAGFNTAAGIKGKSEGPGPFPIFTITYKQQDRERLLTLLQKSDLVRPLGSNPGISTPDDEVITDAFLVISPSSARHIEAMAMKVEPRIDLTIDVPRDFSNLIKLGRSIFAFNPNLYNPHNQDLETGKTTLNTRDKSIHGRLDQIERPQFRANKNITKKGLIRAKEDMKFAAEEIKELPKGPCRGMTIVTAGLSGIKQQEIVNYLHATSINTKYHITKDNLGNIVILGFGQRAGGSLGEHAIKLKEMNPNLSIIMFSTEILETGEDKLKLKQYLPYDEIPAIGEGIYFMARDAKAYLSRDITDLKIESRKGISTKNLTPVDIEVLDVAGGRDPHGPRETIGYENERRTIRNVLRPQDTTQTTKYLIVEGVAGSGKSRLIREAIANNPNVFYVRLDDSEINNQGKSLLRITERIAEQAAKTFPQDTDHVGLRQIINPLLDFCKKTETEKLSLIHKPKSRKKIEELCVDALEVVNRVADRTDTQRPVFYLDDYHFADRLSLLSIFRMASMFNSRIKNGDPLFILARRPEESERVKHEAETHYIGLLQKHFGPNAAVRVSLQDETGKPKVDFSDDDTTYNYVWHSLDETKPEGGVKSKLVLVGDWYTELGKLANTGLEMNAGIQILKPHILVDSANGQIGLANDGLKELGEMIKSGDLGKYLEARVHGEVMTKDMREFLEYLALTGDSISIEKLALFFQKTHPEMKVSPQYLKDKYFITVTPDPLAAVRGERATQNFATFFHPSTGETIRQEMSPAQMERKSFALYKAFQRELPKETLRALLGHMTYNAKVDNQSVWGKYTEITAQTLEEARSQQNFEQGYEVAFETLEGLDIENPNTTIGRALKWLNQKDSFTKVEKESFRHVADIIMNCLDEIIASGFYKGKFADVELAMELIKKAEKAKPSKSDEAVPMTEMGIPQTDDYELDMGAKKEVPERFAPIDAKKAMAGPSDNLKQRYIHAFNAVYASAADVMGDSPQVVKLRQMYGEIEHLAMHEISLSPEEKFILLLQLTYRTQGGAACQKLLEDNENKEVLSSINERPAEGELPSKESIVLRRFLCRTKLEEIRGFLGKGKRIDEDTYFGCPEQLGEEYTRKLFELNDEVDLLLSDVSKVPTALSIIDEVALTEIKGQIIATLLQFEKAEKIFGQEWLTASQVGSAQEAARAAHLLSEAYITSALIGSIDQPPKRIEVNRKREQDDDEIGLGDLAKSAGRSIVKKLKRITGTDEKETISPEKPTEYRYIAGKVIPNRNATINKRMVDQAISVIMNEGMNATKRLDPMNPQQSYMRAKLVRCIALKLYPLAAEMKDSTDARKQEILTEAAEAVKIGLMANKEFHEYIRTTLKNIPEQYRGGVKEEISGYYTPYARLMMKLAREIGVFPLRGKEPNMAQYEFLSDAAARSGGAFREKALDTTIECLGEHDRKKEGLAA